MKQQLTEHQEAWLQALESGNYEQGKRLLKYKEGTSTKYCCLGVWAEMCIQEEQVLSEEDFHTYLFYGNDATLPQTLWQKLGLRDDIGSVGELYDALGGWDALTDANDAGISFKEIARFCRESPEAVFVNR